MRTESHQPEFTGRDGIAAVGVVVIWGLNFVAMKFALKDFTPFQLGAARYLAAFLPLALVVRPPRMHWKWLLLYGLFQGVGQFGLLFVALRVGMTGALASVLMQTQVFFTALLGVMLLGERIHPPLRNGLLLAAVGLLCFGMNFTLFGVDASAVITPLGFVLNLAAAAMWAVSNVVVRRAQLATPGFSPLPFLVWSSAVPIIPFVLLSIVFDAPGVRFTWMDAAWSSWISIAFLGWIATVLAYAMWTGLLKRHSANRVAPFSLGVPVVGLTAGMLILRETITAWQWAGIAFLVAALASVLLGGRNPFRWKKEVR